MVFRVALRQTEGSIGSILSSAWPRPSSAGGVAASSRSPPMEKATRLIFRLTNSASMANNSISPKMPIA
jgi:hypothetical protein